jgi:ketosteroid isomerase-like protein
MRRRQLFQNPIYLFLGSLFFISCAASKGSRVSPDVLLKADTDFSNLSKAKGLRTAFLQYIDDSAVLLKPNQFPIIGPTAKEFYQNASDATDLTWAPQAAYLARSGDLGYTYGIWTIAAKDTTLQGTYVTIWKKQEDGTWKFVLDTGNSGVGKK